MHSIGDGWLWGTFWCVVTIAFLVDLSGLAAKHDRTLPSFQQALWRSLIWMGLALVFNAGLVGYLFWREGTGVALQNGLEFLTAWLLEKSLSVDNLFVILLVFQSFGIPAGLQRRVLLWGVLGAIFLRFLIIFLGIWLVNAFHWILYVFGTLILWSGFRMLGSQKKAQDPTSNPVVYWLSRHVRVTATLHDEHFFVRIREQWWVTPLFIALLTVEASDIIFATDSIPAVFGVTLDSFIVLSSNVFAILGLRALYFLLVYVHDRLEGLQTGVALVLMLTGLKMLSAYWVTLPVVWMPGIIVMVLGATGLMSWIKGRKS